MPVASFLAALALLCGSAPARAFAPLLFAPPEPQSAPLPAPPPSPSAVPIESPETPPETPDEALLDMAFQALHEGNLTLSEQAFRQAAGLSADPARSAVAAAFAERVRRLRTAGRIVPRLSLPGAAGQPGPAATTLPSPNEAPRIFLNVTAAALGLGLYGWTVPVMLGLDAGDSGFLGLYLLTGGVAAIAPYFMTRTSTVTPGQANLAFYGATRGAWHGVLLSAALFGNVGPDRRDRLWAGSLLTGSLAELTAGYFFARAKALTAGEARTIAVGGDFGLGWGLATGAILGLHHDNYTEDVQARGIALMGLVGGTLGVSGGYLLAQRRDNSWGDGEVLRAAGLLGTWVGLSVDALFGWEPEQSDQKKAFSALILGGAAGLWAGDRLVRNTDFTVGESVLVDLSTLGGGLFGAGVAYVVKSGDSSGLSARAFFSATSLGGALGFGLAYAGLRQEALHRANLEETVASRDSTIAILPLIGKKGEQGLSLAGTF